MGDRVLADNADVVVVETTSPGWSDDGEMPAGLVRTIRAEAKPDGPSARRRKRQDDAMTLLNGMAGRDPATWTKTEQRRMARILARVVAVIDLDPGE